MYRRAQNWTQHSQCGLTSADWRGSTTSLDLLVTLLLMQPTVVISLFCCKGVLLAHTQLCVHRVLFYKVAFQLASLQPYCCLGIFLPRHRTYHLLFLKLHEVPLFTFLQPVNASMQPSGVSATTCFISGDLLTMQAVALYRSLMKVLNSNGSSIKHWEHNQ